MANASLHALLFLSDSALPLGSFAFSSGLESCVAHKKLSTTHLTTSAATKLHAADKFLEESVHNVSSTALPYVLAAFHDPTLLPDLDNDFDASTPCTVARRASIAQGRALLQIWERALRATAAAAAVLTPDAPAAHAGKCISELAAQLKANAADDFGLAPNAHFAPLFGAVCVALELSEHQTCYLFLLNHAKAILSAAVRASLIGPYQSQALLAGAKLQACIQTCVAAQAGSDPATRVQNAAVTVPPMDLWMGRHELLYSRIFNS